MAQLRIAPSGYDDLVADTALELARFAPALDGLLADGLVEQHGDLFQLPLASKP